MIIEKISAQSKRYHVHGGDARVFGQDADVRRKLDAEQVTRRFAEVWKKTIAPGLEDAPIVDLDEAKELLGDKRAVFVVPGFEYRQFSVDSAAFLARLSREGASFVCDQLWSIGAHRDPTRLCVYFDKIEDCRRFEEIARRLNLVPRDLLLQLAMDFVKKFDKAT